MNQITIDAKGKSLGRLASEVAYILQGKNRVDYNRGGTPNGVLILNASKIVITGKKLKIKKYYKHTGYLGHLKEKSMELAWKKNPLFVIKKAVAGMLPKNKLRPRRLKLIKIKK